jgi:hypothetical protein
MKAGAFTRECSAGQGDDMDRSGASDVKIDFGHFDQAGTYVVSKGECLVVDVNCRNSDLMEAPTKAIRRGPIAMCDGPLRLEGLLQCPEEPRRLVDVIAACLVDGGAHGDDPGR